MNGTAGISLTKPDEAAPHAMSLHALHARMGKPNGTLSAQKLRDILASHNICFSNTYWTFVCGRVGHSFPGPDREVPYKRLLAPFKSGGRQTDRSGLMPVKNIKVSEAKQLVRTMLLSRLPSGPAQLRRCFQRFDSDGSGRVTGGAPSLFFAAQQRPPPPFF